MVKKNIFHHFKWAFIEANNTNFFVGRKSDFISKSLRNFSTSFSLTKIWLDSLDSKVYDS